QDLAVVAHVDLNAAAQGVQRQEDAAFAAGFPKRLELPAVQAMRPHGIVEEPNFHALAGFARQGFEELVADDVRLEDEVLEMDVMPRGANRLEHGRKSGTSVFVKGHVVAEGHRTTPETLRQTRQRLGSPVLGRACDFRNGGDPGRIRAKTLTGRLGLTMEKAFVCALPSQWPVDVLVAEKQKE